MLDTTAHVSPGAIPELTEDLSTDAAVRCASTGCTRENAAIHHTASVAELYLTPDPDRSNETEEVSKAMINYTRGSPVDQITPGEDPKTSITIPRTWSSTEQSGKRQSRIMNPYVFRFVGRLRRSQKQAAKRATVLRTPTKLRFLEATISERNCVQLQENGKPLPHPNAHRFSNRSVIVEAVSQICERLVYGRRRENNWRGSRPWRPAEGEHSHEIHENHAILHKFVEAKLKHRLSGTDAHVPSPFSVIITPDSLLNFLWEAFVLLTVSWTLVELPLALLMQAKQEYVCGDNWVTSQHVPTIYYADAIFVIDMFVRSRTAFMDENMNLEQDPVLVLSHYLDTAFLVDLSSFIPLLASLFAPGEPFKQLLWSLPRMLRGHRAFTTLDSNTFTSNALAGTGKQLLAQLLYFLLLIYWLACGWFVAGSSKESIIWSWWEIVQANTVKTDTVNSVFFMTLVYTTFNACLGQDVLSSSGRLNGLVSSDTDAAHLPFEVLDLGYCLFLQIIGLLLVYGTLARVIMFIEKFGASRRARNQKRLERHDILKALSISSRLTNRVQEYVSYLDTRDNDPMSSTAKMKLMDRLSCSLRSELLYELHAPAIRAVPMFAGTADPFVQAMCERIQHRYFQHNEYIIKVGEEPREMFFIDSGIVCIIQEHKDPERPRSRSEEQKRYALLKRGSYFGEAGILNATKRVADVQAVTNVDLYSLSKFDLDELLKDAPEHELAMKWMLRQYEQPDTSSEVQVLSRDEAKILLSMLPLPHVEQPSMLQRMQIILAMERITVLRREHLETRDMKSNIFLITSGVFRISRGNELYGDDAVGDVSEGLTFPDACNLFQPHLAQEYDIIGECYFMAQVSCHVSLQCTARGGGVVFVLEKGALFSRMPEMSKHLFANTKEYDNGVNLWSRLVRRTNDVHNNSGIKNVDALGDREPKNHNRSATFAC